MHASAPETSTCSTCGGALEETSSGDMGCMVCLLRVGLSGDKPSEDLPAGDDRFGVYLIERREDGSLHELGRGAMGVTYCAIDTTLQRKVALKIIRIDLAACSSEARERFMRGARAAAALRHENVATIYQFGIREENGQCFYAMELIEGETLEERVRRTGPLDVRTTIAIGQQVADALGVAEKRGLIHRDLKPANLMLVHADESAVPTVKVIDFGLAKAIENETNPMLLTRGFVGTPAFASPEQFSNTPLDVRSDIYSLGATLWFALTGKMPFSGRTVEEIREAQRGAPLAVQQLKAARVPSRVISLLLSMLSLEPASRPRTSELAERLKRLQTSRRRIATAVGVTVLIAALVISLVKPWRDLEKRVTIPEKRAISATGTSNPQAHEAYLKGRSLWAKREYKTHKQAVEYFEKAIALDPNYAEAYAGLADTYPLMANDDPLIARSEDYAKAGAAANKAIELDAMLAEPHAALGLIAMNYEWDWATAEREYKRAIELDPNNPTAHHWYAEYLITQGRSDESLAEIKRAHELDPASIMIMNDTGKILFYSRRYDEAIVVFRKTLEMDPNFLQPHAWLAQVYHEKGMYDEAISEFKAGAVRDDIAAFAHNRWALAMIGRTLAKAGRKDEAEKNFQELQQIRKTHEVEPQFLIPMYLALGDKDEVFALLEKEYDVRSTGLTSLKVNPVYDSLRSDPRFSDLMRRVHRTLISAD